MSTGVLFYPPQSQPLSSVGALQGGMYACFFATGTTTPQTVYSNGTLATPLSQPTAGSVNPSAGTVANSAGVLPVIFLNPTLVYRVQLYTAAGVLISDTDPVFWPGTSSSFSPGTAGAPGISFSTATTTGLYVPAANSLGFATNGLAAGSISSAQAWSIPAAVGANTLTVTGPANFYAGVFTANATSGQSLGVNIAGGTTSADSALLVKDVTSAKTYLNVRGDGVLQGWSATQSAVQDMTVDNGVFSGTFTGYASGIPNNVTWARYGKLVMLNMPLFASTSNATTFTMTGLPAALQPTTIGHECFVSAEDNGANVIGIASITNTGTITFYKSVSGGAWTGSGTKGMRNCTLCYFLA
jgi:hypothetical protein